MYYTAECTHCPSSYYGENADSWAAAHENTNPKHIVIVEEEE